MWSDSRGGRVCKSNIIWQGVRRGSGKEGKCLDAICLVSLNKKLSWFEYFATCWTFSSCSLFHLNWLAFDWWLLHRCFLQKYKTKVHKTYVSIYWYPVFTKCLAETTITLNYFSSSKKTLLKPKILSLLKPFFYLMQNFVSVFFSQCHWKCIGQTILSLCIRRISGESKVETHLYLFTSMQQVLDAI